MRRNGVAGSSGTIGVGSPLAKVYEGSAAQLDRLDPGLFLQKDLRRLWLARASLVAAEYCERVRGLGPGAVSDLNDVAISVDALRARLSR